MIVIEIMGTGWPNADPISMTHQIHYCEINKLDYSKQNSNMYSYMQFIEYI